MSDDLEIRHGRVIAVDTASLRAAAADADAVAEQLAEAARHARVAADRLRAVPDAVRAGADGRAIFLAADVDALGTAFRATAGRLRRAALVYECAELIARRDATSDPTERSALDGRVAALRVENPEVVADAEAAASGGLPVSGELFSQAWWGSWFLGPGAPIIGGALAIGFGLAVRMKGSGVVRAGDRLAGEARAVVHATRQSAARPVGSLAQAARRIPSVGGIRVECYALPGGTRRFVVYLGGTGSGAAFTWGSDLSLYDGRPSGAFEATREALRQAGARPGDVVHAVGYSQGAMIADRLAVEREYDVRSVVAFGSPVQAEVPETTLSIDVRHDDDPIAALAGAGIDEGVGSADSIVAERTAHPEISLEDTTVPAHRLANYTHTAELLDASTDPRMDAARALFAELGTAEAVQSTDYAAWALSSASSAGGAG